MSDPSHHGSPDEQPGAGWTNGAIPPAAAPYNHDPFSQKGKLELYASERRWIGLSTGGGWTRLGESGHEHDSKTGSSVHTGDLVENSSEAVKSLIAQLCEAFYKVGWATGTGGGVSIRIPDPSTEDWRVYVAPSGLQKEDLIGEDIFCLDMDRNVIEAPKTPGLRQSACTPLWYVVYKHRPTATCVIHTHSLHAVLATMLDKTEHSPTLKLTHLEMLKGVGNHAYDDVLEIPIIDNRPSEDQLAEQLEAAVIQYPQCNAVLVRRHGLYCWGDSWEQAKTHCESFDYLLDCAVKMTQMGMNPAKALDSPAYRVTDKVNAIVASNKKRKLGSGFNGVGAVDNSDDCLRNSVPLLPRDGYKVLLLDIEGCTTSISFVHDTLFPYARQHLPAFAKSLDPNAHQELLAGLLQEVKSAGGSPDACTSIEDLAFYLMDRDVKSSVLKDIQGRIWREGYTSGQLKGHVYQDFVPLLQWLSSDENNKVKVYIYSSGSIQAQKLLFGFSEAGDLLSYFAGHFDIPTAGPKKESASYTKIAASLQMDPADIVFVSDAVAELEAAAAAGIGATVMSIRPGNAPLSAADAKKHPTVHSLLQLCGA